MNYGSKRARVYSLVSSFALAIEMGAVPEDLALTVHPHPTLSETESEAAEAFLGIAIYPDWLRRHFKGYELL